MEDIKLMLANLDHKFTTSFSNMEIKYDSVVNSIASLERNVTEKLHEVELKFTGEIEVLKDSCERLSVVVSQEAKENNERFINVDERVAALKEAQQTIGHQNNKIIQLERLVQGATAQPKMECRS